MKSLRDRVYKLLGWKTPEEIEAERIRNEPTIIKAMKDLKEGTKNSYNIFFKLAHIDMSYI